MVCSCCILFSAFDLLRNDYFCCRASTNKASRQISQNEGYQVSYQEACSDFVTGCDQSNLSMSYSRLRLSFVTRDLGFSPKKPHY